MDKLSQVQVNRIYQNVGQKTPGCVLGTSGGRGISDTREPHNFMCDSEIICECNDYTNPNTNPKTLSTLILTLTA